MRRRNRNERKDRLESQSHEIEKRGELKRKRKGESGVWDEKAKKKKKLTSSVSSAGKLLALESKGPQDPRGIWMRMKIKKILKLILDG